MYVPTKMFLCKGVGTHREWLTSFEMALRDAGIATLNVVRVSSIFPPGCRMITPKQGFNFLRPGQVTHCVLSQNSTKEPNRLIAAAIGVAVPNDLTQYGYLSEHHSFGQNNKQAGDYAEDLAATMMATTLGIDFDINKSYDEQRDIWKISGKVVKTRNVTVAARGRKTGGGQPCLQPPFLCRNSGGPKYYDCPVYVLCSRADIFITMAETAKIRVTGACTYEYRHSMSFSSSALDSENNFLGLESRLSSFSSSPFIIIQAPLERTTVMERHR